MTKDQVIWVDTREKNPVSFMSFPGTKTEPHVLKYGDYSMAGKTQKAVVEWKSARDWAACNYTRTARERLEKQLGLLREQVKEPLLLIHIPVSEESLTSVFSRVRPGFRERLIDYAYARMTQLPVILVSDRYMAADVIRRWLRLHG